MQQQQKIEINSSLLPPPLLKDVTPLILDQWEQRFKSYESLPSANQQKNLFLSNFTFQFQFQNYEGAHFQHRQRLFGGPLQRLQKRNLKTGMSQCIIESVQ